MNDSPETEEKEWGVYRGFPLRRVTWGYRDRFRRLLDSLHEKGLLGPPGRTTMDVCGPFLDAELTVGEDHVLKEFLSALDGHAGPLMRVPHLFEDWRRIGLKLANRRLYLGQRYFELWGGGDLPVDPRRARALLDWTERLLEEDPRVACALLEGWPRLRRMLALDDLPDFIETGLTVFQRNPDSAQAWFRLDLKSAEVHAERLSRTARLDRLRPRLARLYRAVSCHSVEAQGISRLDSDELLECGSRVVACEGQLFVPNTVSFYGPRSANTGYYLLVTLIAAMAARCRGFDVWHGRADAQTLVDAWARLHPDAPPQGAFLCDVAEKLRLRRRLLDLCPGAEGLWQRVAMAEPTLHDTNTPAARLIGLAVGALSEEDAGEGVAGLLKLLEPAVEAENWIAMAGTVAELIDPLPEAFRELPLPVMAEPLTFWPDANFPLSLSEPPPAELLDASSARPSAEPEGREADDAEPRGAEEMEAGGEEDAEGEGEEETEDGSGLRAVFLYDEWDGLQGEYYRDWCHVSELRPRPSERTLEDDARFRQRVEHVKRLFQRLRPDLVTREKHLLQGDMIDVDRLVRYITQHKARTSPQPRFWMKPRRSRRDLAVALLLDVSGSTGREAGDRNVITVEKQAAHMLAAGLAELGDRFAIYGFTGNGRENCRFYVYKQIEEEWSEDNRRRLAAAHPGAATRMGVALRHAGSKLSGVEARTRLIIVITDGRPMDSGYDPNTHYAHYDVRRACAENAEAGIHTFCIAMGDEEPPELDMMFPARRYMILPDVNDLPHALANAYLRLTKD